ncbi:putative bifunctional diguanylate cyclase/phosphodiesterase [Sphingobium sp. CCH11-B1]|jgi:diguanylate cyclase (GGDEF)-like protein/PAS domain S-box-containing protein|uniref:putative bifunctional diguanylate cyclase/phosphodiesterase n=1 Tax=Sphingobium sp. CCH11-B1 TaxID=1768781 RepID=UPI00082D0795|nr:GGDEF domain-containing phosphodiesterase [Sphingobium sp. CCH11-B1]MEA3388925.1 EAL domain-containing protein [Pseudomonadota bacterium]
MDRLADHRFSEMRVALDAGLCFADVLLPIDDLATLCPSGHLSPPLVRWAVDRRGRLISLEERGGHEQARFAADPIGLAWTTLLTGEHRRNLIRAALGGTQAEPLLVQIRCFHDRPRWFRVTLARVDEPGSPVGWRGTLENMEDCTAASDLSKALAESQEHYRWSFELSPQVPWTAGPDGSIQEVGPRWFELTGMPPDQALGTGWIGALHPDDIERTIAIWTGSLVSGAPVDIEYRVLLRDGGYRWMRARAAPRRDADGCVVRWYGTLEDVHAERLARSALSDSEERFRLAVQSARLGIWDFDCISGVRTWSAEFRAMLGISADQPATTELALDLVHPEDRDRLKHMLDAVAQGGGALHFEATLRIRRADTGALRWIRSTGWTSRTDGGAVSRIIVTFLDVTEERNAEERIRWAATHDSMTRLPNRTRWQASLETLSANAQQHGDRFGLLLLDIDDLKRTNDALGHDAGDALLCAFAEKLSSVAPADAVVGRLGGDEFGLIAPTIDSEAGLESLSRDLMEACRMPVAHQGRLLEFGVSIGGAIFGNHAVRADELLKAADLALYASKRGGRSRLTVFHSELRAEAQQRTSMIHMARQIVADRLVVPYYQPKVDMRTGRLLGFEALLRWHHPRLGIQLPGAIAAAFLHSELAVGLTVQMLEGVLADLRLWLNKGLNPGRVAINASPADFARGDFSDRVLDHLHRMDIPAAHFEIEVTESVLLGNGGDQVARAMGHFADAGVRLALDDFGTGFASLSHLKQYPVDIIKIDRSFVQDVERDEGNAAIVDAIVKLGGSFGMEVVAEGVETPAQADHLLALGCVVGQGYYFGRPLPLEATHALIAAQE